MRKIIAVLTCSIMLLSADILEDKIINIIGEKSYTTNKNFLNKIFANPKNFYINSNVNIQRVIRELSTNGLIVLKFAKPETVNITFTGKITPILLTKSINNVLSTMGYSYYEVTKAEYKDGDSKISFGFIAEYAPDPLMILEEFKKHGFAATDVIKYSNVDWEYKMDLIDLRLPNSQNLTLGDTLQLREVGGEYWLRVRQKGNLEIVSNNSRGFSPRIVFYDNNLEIISIFVDKKSKQKVQLQIPENVKFALITDFENPQSLKGGITVRFF